MRLSGGAAGYELDFGGTLLRDAEAKIEAGMSGVEMKIPASTAAKIVAETTLGRVDVEDGFTKREGAFWTEAGMTGKRPLLTMLADTMMPEAFRYGGKQVGPVTTLGFALAFFITTLE